MEKSLISKIIIGALSGIVLIIIIVTIINNINKDKPDEIADVVQQYENETRGKLVKVDNLTDLYTVKVCIQKYYENYCAINCISKYNSGESDIGLTSNTAIQLADENNRNKDYFKDVTYSMLAPDYINKLSINKDNLTKDDRGFENISVEIYNLYCITEYEDVYVYFVDGIIRNSDTNEGFDFNYIVSVDVNNCTFEIYLDNYLEDIDFSNLQEGSEIAFTLPKSIEKREYNTYSVVSIKYDQAVQDTFYNIRRLMLYDTEKAYNLLSDEMKQKYTTYSDFENYINENNKKIFALTYGSYQLKSGENGTVFVMYNSNSTMKIIAYFDGFSSFKFYFEEIESYK